MVTRIPGRRSQGKQRVAAYARVSSMLENQDESFEEQEAYFVKKIRANPEWEFAGVYGERKSGTHADDRESFNLMMKDALEGKIDLIFCKSVSRWARNAVEGLKAIKLLTGNRVNVVFEQEGIDTRMPGIALQLNMASSIAQSESESLSETMKWTYRKRAERGIFAAQPGVYFGFNTDDGGFTPDGNAAFVKAIFRRYRDGMTMQQISDWLNAEGVKTVRGNDFTREAVGSILKNEKYVGDLHFGKRKSRNIITGEKDTFQIDRTLRNHHTAIVDRETWEAVQKRLPSKKS